MTGTAKRRARRALALLVIVLVVGLLAEPAAAQTIVPGGPSAPDTYVDSGPADPTTETQADFTFSADDPSATFECSLDGGGWAPCSSPKALTGLAAGTHTFEARAVDPAGNVDPTPAAHAWTVT